MSSTIVQITDTHISQDVPQRAQELKKCVQAINSLDIKPELVIHTGDITHNGLPEEYHTAKTLLDELTMRYYVIPGNKDKREALRDTFKHDKYEIPNTGWIQYSIESLPTRLLLLDTQSYDSNQGKLCADRLAHLERMLKADSSKPVALFLHHPPYEAIGIPDPWQYEDWADVDKLANIIAANKQITSMYCGHVHRYIDGQIAGIKASAITCLASDLRKGEMSDEDRVSVVYKVLDI
jgi:3',5'-cyclic AMP phosphodiesterase CpdA